MSDIECDHYVCVSGLGTGHGQHGCLWTASELVKHPDYKMFNSFWFDYCPKCGDKVELVIAENVEIK